MAEGHIHKNLANKRKEIQAYIGSLERDLEQARTGTLEAHWLHARDAHGENPAAWSAEDKNGVKDAIRAA